MRLDVVIWLGAFTLSLALHALLLSRDDALIGMEEREQNARMQSTRVSFRAQAAPPPAAEVPAKPPKEPPPKRVEESPPKPVQKPQLKPEPPKPEPTPPEPDKSVIEQQPAPASSEVVEESPVEEVQAAALPPPSVSDAEAEALRAAARRHYLARLMAHIEAHKHYPRNARRRGIEGKVSVRFQLLAGGRAGEPAVEGGHRLLRAAAREAVEAAQPLPPPPKDIALPLPVEFAIRFQLH